MKRMAAVSAVLALCLRVAQAAPESAALHFDGIYHRTDRDQVTQHFRFYRDGTVISVATPVEMTPAKIARWFHRDWPSIAKGHYSVRGNSVQITLKNDLPGPIPEQFRKKLPGTIHYAGEIGPDHLVLRRDGSAEGKRHNFAKVLFAK
jgi:hypothetical protein